MSSQTESSTRTIHRVTQDDTIGGCQLHTLAKIADALSMKTKNWKKRKN
ncbi:hypothetical protein [uncultured Bilophila sp.]|nr:hypothetical protein [uncultured Bilophila sp.]